MTKQAQIGIGCQWEEEHSPLGTKCREGGDANSELPPFGMESKIPVIVSPEEQRGI